MVMWDNSKTMDVAGFPKMALARQELYREEISDVGLAVVKEIDALNLKGHIRPGMRVAITAGSRGIDRIAEVLKACVDFLKELGVMPFLYPAMGSHGGATAEGQLSILADYGITEEAMGVPIHASMAVVELGVTHRGIPVFLDRVASEADALVVVNRVKTHTKFEGEIESGLFKMMAIGMGKHKGAAVYHRAAVDHGMEAIIVDAGELVIRKKEVLFGLGIVENGVDRITRLKAMRPEAMFEEEKMLLRFSKKVMARIPFDKIDLLIVDEIGKNISGTGMDSKVIGRHRDLIGEFSIFPHPKRIFVRDLTDASEGNATGIGLADFTTKRCVKKIDMKKTAVNCLTALSPEKAALPLSFATDREAIYTALKTVGLKSVADLRVMRIKNTLALETFLVSEGFQKDVSENPGTHLLEAFREMTFDDAENLLSFAVAEECK